MTSYLKGAKAYRGDPLKKLLSYRGVLGIYGMYSM